MICIGLSTCRTEPLGRLLELLEEARLLLVGDVALALASAQVGQVGSSLKFGHHVLGLLDRGFLCITDELFDQLAVVEGGPRLPLGGAVLGCLQGCRPTSFSI